jgi:hypothetical protein
MTAAGLDAELTTAYAEEAVLYEQGLTLAEQIALQVEKGTAADALLGRIRELLARVQLVEDRVAMAKSQWHERGYRPSGPLAAMLARVAELIHRMQSHLNGARVHAELRKQDLAPALDECIRQRQMRSAYRG